ncbi:MAG: carbamoyltransferase [Verrucomicrobiales bacterium]|jgi:carbamoyltransferase
MNILGVSAFYHDSAAALIVDGKIVAAAQEERFTRIKHDPAFPTYAVDYCLEEAGITPEQVDYVAFYEKPLLKFDRLLETYLSYAPAGLKSFKMALPIWLKKKLYLKREMNKGLHGKYKGRFVFPEHHESHAASAFFPSPFDEAAILTVDGVGEWATTTWGVGKGNKIELQHELRFPHSLGLLYSAFTFYCGFRVNSGEYKLMGLAPYGEPKYVDRIAGKVIRVLEDGSFRLDMNYFNYCQGLTMTNKAFEELMGQPRRASETDLSQFYMDVAASIQVVTEDIMLKIGRHIQKETGMKKLCLAGGVALNCVSNGRLLREGPFEDVWIQPAAGDAGGALGAAEFVWHQLLDNPRNKDSDQGPSFLGPSYSQESINAVLDAKGAVYDLAETDDEMCDKVADLIASEKVIGWVQGRMEFGPRALGARSILGDARSEEMQKTMNLKIKFRESFRPFAPVILRERAHEYFDVRLNEDSPYMLLVAPVKEDKRIPLNGNAEGVEGLNKLNLKRSVVPAITHVDYSARIQTTDAERHGVYHKLIEAFESKTGSPVMINTSFNVRGEPIVCKPEDAYHCFMGTNMDVLVLGRAILKKEDQPEANLTKRDDYLKQFALD